MKQYKVLQSDVMDMAVYNSVGSARYRAVLMDRLSKKLLGPDAVISDLMALNPQLADQVYIQTGVVIYIGPDDSVSAPVSFPPPPSLQETQAPDPSPPEPTSVQMQASQPSVPDPVVVLPPAQDSATDQAPPSPPLSVQTLSQTPSIPDPVQVPLEQPLAQIIPFPKPAPVLTLVPNPPQAPSKSLIWGLVLIGVIAGFLFYEDSE